MIEILCETAAWPARTRRVAGFSLVEMAVVTLLVAIFLTMGLAAFRASQDAQAVSTTLAKQNAIKDALIGYLRRNGRLPCADIDFSSPDGIENRSTAGDPTTACATSPSNARFGLVPYNTLGLARDAAVDGWGNFFSYQVSNSVSSDAFNPGTPSYNTPIPGYYRDWTLTANFRSGNTGEITVNDRDATGAVITVASNVVVVIVSYGPNGYGAHTISGTANSAPPGADELQNTDGDTVYFARTATTDDTVTGGAFDDRVMFLKAEDLLAPLFKDGSMKPPAAQLADTFRRIQIAIGQYLLAYPVPYASYSSPYNVSYGTSNCSTTVSPPGTPWCRRIPLADVYNGDGNAGNNAPLYDGGVPYANLGMGWSDVWDPWGRPIRYTVNPLIQSVATNGISSTVPAGLNLAYTLQSFGPDRTPGGGDDLSVTVTVTDLRNGLTGLLP